MITALYCSFIYLLTYLLTYYDLCKLFNFSFKELIFSIFRYRYKKY